MAYKTEDNLRDAFNGESAANRRYTFFAERAEKDGYPQVARLFRAVAEAETVHARNHLTAFDAIGSTKDNLMAATMGEREEFTWMYPDYIEKAKEELNERARITFEWANRVEKIHYDLFEETLKLIRDGKTPPDKVYYVCQRCGNTVAGEAPERCPICGAPRDAFKRVD
ncbi:MAG: rubrerythrin family protein [Dehalococcoidales bacterium]|nr:rubrerythrin family protein [Dehalococcoidales bacterium]